MKKSRTKRLKEPGISIQERLRRFGLTAEAVEQLRVKAEFASDMYARLERIRMDKNPSDDDLEWLAGKCREYAPRAEEKDSGVMIPHNFTLRDIIGICELAATELIGDKSPEVQRQAVLKWWEKFCSAYHLRLRSSLRWYCEYQIFGWNHREVWLYDPDAAGGQVSQETVQRGIRREADRLKQLWPDDGPWYRRGARGPKPGSGGPTG